MKIIAAPRGKFQLKSEYDPRLVEKLKAVPGFTWNSVSRVWEGYEDAYKVLAEKYPPIAVAVASAFPLLEKQYHTDDSRFGGERIYQKETVEFALPRLESGCLIALEMGLGKSLCALRIANKLGAKTIVVCPAYIRGVWKAEIAKWAFRAEAFDCRSRTATAIPPKLDFAIVNYEVLGQWVKSLQEWAGNAGLVVFDEVHVAVSDKSQRAAAMREIASSCKWKLGLTGTPFTGRLKAMWNVMDTLSPGRFGSFFKYGMAYCAGHSVTIDFRVDGPKQVYDFSGSSREEELAKRLQCFMFRRTREEVALELPPLTRQILRVDCKSRRIDYSDFDQAMFRAALEAAADSKFPEVCRLVQGHAEEGHKVVVFTYRKAVAEAVAKEMAAAGIDSAFIHSGVTDSKRQAILAAPPQVLAATIDSVQMGISLTHADVGVFAELSYEPAKLRQAEARLHRFGQKAGVLIQYVIGADSVDELVVDKVLSKLDLEVAVVGAGGEVLAGDLRGNSEEDAFQNIIAGLS